MCWHNCFNSIRKCQTVFLYVKQLHYQLHFARSIAYMFVLSAVTQFTCQIVGVISRDECLRQMVRVWEIVTLLKALAHISQVSNLQALLAAIITLGLLNRSTSKTPPVS